MNINERAPVKSTKNLHVNATCKGVWALVADINNWPRVVGEIVMLLDRIGFHVSDVAKSREFFVKALSPLGFGIVAEGVGWAMIGRSAKGQFWFGAFGNSPRPIHMAFASGGRDNGAPGLLTKYHPNYYGAFVIGPDGHNVQAVCHASEA
jgi:catechol 2,3-dioxygenase-like lactoylglutathione lyase family enzyme